MCPKSHYEVRERGGSGEKKGRRPRKLQRPRLSLMKMSQLQSIRESAAERNADRPEMADKEDITPMTLEPYLPDAPLYNSKIIASFIRYIERYYGHIDLNELMDYAKMAPYQVEDEDHWFSQEQVDLFHEKLVALTKNQNIAREAGRDAVSTDSLGVAKVTHWAS